MRVVGQRLLEEAQAEEVLGGAFDVASLAQVEEQYLPLEVLDENMGLGRN